MQNPEIPIPIASHRVLLQAHLPAEPQSVATEFSLRARFFYILELTQQAAEYSASQNKTITLFSIKVSIRCAVLGIHHQFQDNKSTHRMTIVYTFHYQPNHVKLLLP
jgi:hypothetical protein